MPRFARPLNIPALAQQPQIISGYIAGRAANMAYQNDKARNRLMQMQAAELAYGASPEQRALQTRRDTATAAVNEANAYRIANPELDIGIKQIRDGEDYVTVQTINDVPVPDQTSASGFKEIGRSKIATGTVADTNLLGKRATGDVETQIIDLQGALNEVNRINLDDANDLLTYQGKAESFLARQANKLGVASDAQIARIHKDQQLRSQVRQAFQKIRKAVTGAQAAFIELQYLEDAYFSDKMSPDQLRAAKKVFIDSTRAAINVLTNLKQRGLQQGTPEFAAEFDKQWQQIKPEEVDQFIPQPQDTATAPGKDVGGGITLTFD